MHVKIFLLQERITARQFTNTASRKSVNVCDAYTFFLEQWKNVDAPEIWLNIFIYV